MSLLSLVFALAGCVYPGPQETQEPTPRPTATPTPEATPEPTPEPTPTASPYETERVVLVIVDGIRYTEGLGDPEALHAPRMAALAEQGALVEPFLNNESTITSRAIPAIWSGSWAVPNEVDAPECSAGSTNRAKAPTVFEYYRKGLDRPEEDCVYVVGDVGCPWQPSDARPYGMDFWPRFVEQGRTDTERWEAAQEVLANDAPGFLLLYLSDVDTVGHQADWEGYLEAIATADGIVGDLWDTLQASPAYAGKTTMIVTNDHGRHDNRPSQAHDGFSGHGDDCGGCQQIQLLMVGPDTPAGLVSGVERTLADVTPTIGHLLGFSTELATGSPMVELLDGAR